MFNLTPASTLSTNNTNNSSSTYAFLSTAIDLFTYWWTGKNPQVTAQIQAVVTKSEFQVNTDTLSDKLPTVAGLKTDGFAVTWRDGYSSVELKDGCFEVIWHDEVYSSILSDRSPTTVELKADGFVADWHDTDTTNEHTPIQEKRKKKF